MALLVLVPYGYLYFLMSAAVSRRQELEADRAAARLAGRASMISALRELPGLVAAWEFYLQTYVNPGLRMTTLAPANVLSYFPTLLAARSGELAAIRAQSPPAQRSRWDSHPPPANRIAMLEREPDSPVPADLRPGAVMIPYLEAVAVELEASAFDFGDRPRVPFDQYLAATAQAVHQQAADRFYRGLARIAGLAFPHLATALELLAAGRHRDFAAVLAPAAGPDVAYTVVRDALASAIAVAVSSRGLGQWQGSWAGAPMLLGPGGVTIDCRAWAERALRGEAARVRDELADWGVDLTVSAVRATVTADGAELVAALVNVRINRKRQDLVILDTGLVILPPVPLLRSGVAGNRMAELLQQGVPAVTAVPDSQFIPYEMIIAASVRGRLWIRFRFRLHTGERLTIKPANDSGDLGGGWVALRQAVGRFASAGNPVVTPVPAAGGLRLDGPR